MESLTHYLERFYDRLYNNLLFKKKLKLKSVLLSLLEIKSNERYRVLDESSIDNSRIPRDIFLELLAKKLIRGTDRISNYTISIEGIWEIESEKGIINKDNLLGYLDKKMFQLFEGNKPLSDKEKIIILSMIATRTFSEKSSVDLKKSDIALNAWKEVVDSSYLKLTDLKIISIDYEKLYGKLGNERPVSNLLRHTDALPKKTKGLYKAIGSQKYYLDIYKDSNVSQENLSYLFRLIFNGKLGPSEVDSVLSFCKGLTYEKSIYLFDLKEHIFSNPSFDDLLKNALIGSIINQD